MTDTSAAPDVSLGRAIAERQRPLRARRGSIAGLTASPGRPGVLGRRSTSFSMAAGLSLTSRRELGMVNPDPDVSWLPVAPPAEWDESLLPIERVRTGDATLDHIIATQQATRPAESGPRRGLRSAIGRRNTPTGRNTAPGASAHRLRPQSAPPALNPDVRRAVSGDASRPRAPRSGPAGGPPSSRAPSSRTGRRARDRVERSAPWHHHSAQPATPLSPRVTGPVSMSGRRVADPTPPGPIGTTLPAGTRRADILPADMLPADTLPANAVAMESAPVGVQPADLPTMVADIAASVIDHAMGDPAADLSGTGWGLARSAKPLVPSVRAPGASSTAARSGSAAMSPTPPTFAASPSWNMGSPSNMGSSSQLGRSPAGTATARMAERRRAAQPIAPVGATRPPAAGASSSLAAGVASSPVVDRLPTPMARATAAAMDSAISPPPGVPVAASTGASATAPAAASTPIGREPALAAMLRAAPPALSLATSPQRSFTLLGGTAPGAGTQAPAGRPTQLAGPLATAPAGRPAFAGPAPTLAGMPLGAGGLPVGGGTVVGGATGASVPNTARADTTTAPARAMRGLGSVASLVSTPAPHVSAMPTGTAATSTRSARASSPASSSAASLSPAPLEAATSWSASSSAAARSTSADHARRAVRRLPDLAIPVPSTAFPSTSMPLLAGGLASAVAGQAGGAQGPVTPGRAAATARAAMEATPDPGARRPALPFTPSPSFTPSTRLASLVGRATPLAVSSSAPGVPATTASPATPSTGMVAPPPAVPVDPGERFDQVLAQHAGPSLSKLPQRFEPIARAILPNPGRVRVSTGRASRQALAAVGKVAATAGDVVHLARPLDETRQSIDILAHELTHVANPSPLVRFFDDDRDSHEERQAREMGSIMAAAPVGTPPAAPPPRPAGAPSSGGAGWGPGNMPPLPPLPPPPAPAVDGDAGGPPVPPPAGAPAGTLPPWANQIPQLDGGDDAPAGVGAGAAPTLDIDRLLDALESRVIRELERRGRRWPRPM